jgi:hypothetical protein
MLSLIVPLNSGKSGSASGQPIGLAGGVLAREPRPSHVVDAATELMVDGLPTA